MTFKLPEPGDMRIDTTAEGDDGKAMEEAVVVVKAAIEKYIGVECDIAIGVHPHHGPGEACGAVVVTPRGMDIGLTANVLWKSLGGIQAIMAEMPDANDTMN